MNGASSTRTKVLRLRLKDKHAKILSDLAREVNFVWNYCNDLQITMFNRERRFLSGYDFAKFTARPKKDCIFILRLCRQSRRSTRRGADNFGRCG
jgi:hypothetical protein